MYLIMKSAIFLSFFLLSTSLSHAQTNLDSLWSIWNDDTAPDSGRTMAMHDITWDGYLFSQPDSAFFFAQMLYDFASDKELTGEMAWALRTQGVTLFLRSEYQKALDYYNQSVKLYEDISDKKGLAKSLNNIGVVYLNQGDYPKALYYLKRSFKIKVGLTDKNGMISVLSNPMLSEIATLI